jgi:hypothetical protein
MKEKQTKTNLVPSEVTFDAQGGEHHPSYGLVRFSHVSSNRTAMVGSRAFHSRLISIEVDKSYLHRSAGGIGESWMGDATIVRAFITYSQFAELISSMNQGSGVPCTLSSVMNERMPEPPLPEAFAARFKKRVMDATAKMRNEVKGLLDFVTDIRDENRSVNKKDLTKIVAMATSLVQQTEQNVPYVVTQAEEVMIDMTQKARDEINHLANQTLYERGLQSTFNDSPIQLPEDHETRALSDGI